jgi:NADPH2:quinone reductase
MAKAATIIPTHMNAMSWHGEHTPLPLMLVCVSVPKPKKAEVLIKVAYAGVNRAEVFQRNRHYPLPTSVPRIPGIEYSGTVARLGAGTKGVKLGQRVCGIITEGGYAEYITSPASMVLPVPENLSLKEAACLPEAMLTAWVSLMEQAALKKGETVLIHGGGSGVGVMAIQMARVLGAQVIVTAGNDSKCTKCKKLGAHHTINYNAKDFEVEIERITNGKGVDVILDMVGGDYTQKHLSILKTNGRLAIISFLRGAKTQVNLAPVLLKKLAIFGSILRNRPLSEKSTFVKNMRKQLWKSVKTKKIIAVIDSTFTLEDAKKALDRMEENLNFGKILLQVGLE